MDSNSDIVNYSNKVKINQGYLFFKNTLPETVANNNCNENEKSAQYSEMDLPKADRLLGDRYVLMDFEIDSSTITKCLDTHTNEEFLCKIAAGSHQKILRTYFRLTAGYSNGDDIDMYNNSDRQPLIRPLRKVIQSSTQTYLLISNQHFGDLHSYIKDRKRLTETEAKELFRQICQTVELCHDNGIILRDLKLRRFIFTDHDRKKLQCESLESSVLLDDPNDDTVYEKIGCPTYVAPELLKVNSTYGGKLADSWSLGIILYTMLVGRYPFNASTPSNLFAKISNGNFQIPGWLSSTAKCLIRSLLRQNPDERLTSQDILFHPWFQDAEDDFSMFDEDTNMDHCVPELFPEVNSLELT